VCCGVLRCVAVCCSVLQHAAACCIALSIAVEDELSVALCCSLLQRVADRCSVLFRWVAVCCSASQCVAVYCRALQCIAVCRSVLQWVAICCSVSTTHKLFTSYTIIYTNILKSQLATKFAMLHDYKTDFWECLKRGWSGIQCAEILKIRFRNSSNPLFAKFSKSAFHEMQCELWL